MDDEHVGLTPDQQEWSQKFTGVALRGAVSLPNGGDAAPVPAAAGAPVPAAAGAPAIPGGAIPGGADPGGANPGGANPGGANPGGANPEGSGQNGSAPGGAPGHAHTSAANDPTGGGAPPAKQKPVNAPVPPIFSQTTKTKAELTQLVRWRDSGHKTIARGGKPIDISVVLKQVVTTLTNAKTKGLAAVTDLGIQIEHLSGDKATVEKLRGDALSLMSKQQISVTTDLAENFQSITAALRQLHEAEAAASELAEKAIRLADHAVNIVTGLRDGCQEAAATLALAAGPLGAFLIASLNEAEKAYDNSAKGEPVNLGKLSMNIFLAVVVSKLGPSLQKSVEKGVGPWVEQHVGPALEKALDAPAFRDVFTKWVTDHAEKAEAGAMARELVRELAEGNIHIIGQKPAQDLFLRFIAEEKIKKNMAAKLAKMIVDTPVNAASSLLATASGALYAKIRGQENKTMKQRCEEFVKEVEEGAFFEKKKGPPKC